MWRIGEEMRRFLTILVVLGVVAGVGCEREQAVEPPEPAVQVVLEEPAEAEDPVMEEVVEEEPSPPAASFESWPGREEHRTFELTWLGGEEEAELRQEPDRGADVIARARFFDGEQVEWTQTQVQVVRPRPYQAQQAMRWSGLPYDAEYMEVEAGERQFEFEEGDQLYLYQYGGEGTCFWGVEQEIVLGSCPLDGWRALEGGEDAPWQPLEQEWWVKVKSGQAEGWILVDEAPVEVRLRYLEGFDSFDEHDEPDY